MKYPPKGKYQVPSKNIQEFAQVNNMQNLPKEVLENTIFLSQPYFSYLDYKEEIDAAIQEVLNSGVYVNGPHVKKFENDFAHYSDCEIGVGMNNATDGLEFIIRALDIKPGDEVIVPANTFQGTLAGVYLVGATPVFCDIDKNTFNIDPQKVRDLITPKTKAIIAVHLYGYPADIDELLNIAQAHNLYLIEDCAQAHGATYKGKRVGSFGVAGVFSCYPTKNISGIGDGGILTTNDQNIASKVREFKDYGWRDGERYNSMSLGRNSRLQELQAAILNVKLKYLDEDNLRRRNLAKIYTQELQGIVGTPQEHDATHVYYNYVIKTDKRAELMAFLRTKGIVTAKMYPKFLYEQPSMEGFLKPNQTLEVCEKVKHQIMSLPMYPQLTDDQVYYICNCIKEFYGK